MPEHVDLLVQVAQELSAERIDKRYRESQLRTMIARIEGSTGLPT